MELITIENYINTQMNDIIAAYPRIKPDLLSILNLCRTDYSPWLLIKEYKSLIPIIGYWKAVCDSQRELLKKEMAKIRNRKRPEAKKILGSKPTKEQLTDFLEDDADFNKYSLAVVTWDRLRKILNYLQLGFEPEILVQASVNERKESERDGTQY